MQTPRWSLAVLIAVGLSLAVPATGHSQLGSLKKKAEEAAKKKLEEATKKASADSAKAKAAADSAKAKAARTRQRQQRRPGGGGASALRPSADPKIWDNYDFVPGNKVIFYTDFSRGPRRATSRAGSNSSPARWMSWSETASRCSARQTGRNCASRSASSCPSASHSRSTSSRRRNTAAATRSFRLKAA